MLQHLPPFMRLSALIALLTALIPQPTLHAQAPSDPTENRDEDRAAILEITRDVLQQAGLDGWLTSFEAVLKLHSTDAPNSPAALLFKVYDRTALGEAVAAAMADSLTLQDAYALRAWIDQPIVQVGQAAVRRYVNDPHAERNYAAFTEALGTDHPIDSTRARLAYTMAETTDGAQVTAKVGFLYEEVLRGERFSPTARADRYAEQLTYWRDQAVLLNYYTYRDLPVGDWEAYLRALDTPVGLRFYRGVIESCALGLAAWAGSVADEHPGSMTDGRP